MLFTEKQLGLAGTNVAQILSMVWRNVARVTAMWRIQRPLLLGAVSYLKAFTRKLPTAFFHYLGCVQTSTLKLLVLWNFLPILSFMQGLIYNKGVSEMLTATISPNDRHLTDLEVSTKR